MVNDVTQLAPSTDAPHAFAETQAAPSTAGSSFAAPISAARTTVLPRIDGDGVHGREAAEHMDAFFGGVRREHIVLGGFQKKFAGGECLPGLDLYHKEGQPVSVLFAC